MKKRYTIVTKTYDKKGRLLSVATNNYNKGHPLMQYLAQKAGLPEKTRLHSEVLALIRAKDKQVYRLSVERYHADGTPALAKPCPVCQEAIKAFGVTVVEYTSPVESTSPEGWIYEART